MDIRDMHYDFKIKYNKIDSNGNEHLEIPEIDWLINEAAEEFVRTIAQPYYSKIHGFEINQRTIDSISPLVQTIDLNVVDGKVELPSDYFFFISGIVTISKGKCKNKEGILLIKQHDDIFQFDSFQDSSFEWREVVGNFEGNNIILYVKDFTVEKVKLTYIKRMPYLHNAEDFNPGIGYRKPSGELLTGRSHCILSDDVCKDIVDIAVLLAAQNTGIIPKYNLRINKLKQKQITNE